MTGGDVLTVLCVGAGAVFFLAGSVGLLRFPDTLTRLHALTKADKVLSTIDVLPDGRLAVSGSFTEVGAVGSVPGSGAASGLAMLDCTTPP